MKDQISLDEIKAIIDLVRQTESVTDFTLRVGDVEISLSRGTQSGGSKRAASSSAATREPVADGVASLQRAPKQTSTPTKSAKVDSEPGEGEIVIKSPMVGTFYRCPKPGDPSFVEIGTVVKEDTVLCIIEVMKLMNSLEAKVSGVVTRILVDDASPVEHGQPLMIIKTNKA